ncbi:hypothetical protein RDI58_023088 [Solanum bulbocastanum]|uniref:Uncharacterized protein n=1 Tax=Solanum bulbocastanum TaxID=147425 RepID=A0AAN8T6X0_SOLBU
MRQATLQGFEAKGISREEGEALLKGMDFVSYNNFQVLPKEAKALLNMDKSQVPNLRITMLQNGNFSHNG